MEFVAELDQLAPMLDYIRDWAKKNNVPASDLYKMELASEEALVNVIHYAYPEKKEGNNKPVVFIDLKTSKDYLEIHIKDKGIPFNPLEHNKDIGKDLPIEERKIGGLGIFLVRKLMDNVAYQRENGENFLVLYFKKKENP